jgi:hypothetical protein
MSLTQVTIERSAQKADIEKWWRIKAADIKRECFRNSLIGESLFGVCLLIKRGCDKSTFSLITSKSTRRSRPGESGEPHAPFHPHRQPV